MGVDAAAAAGLDCKLAPHLARLAPPGTSAAQYCISLQYYIRELSKKRLWFASNTVDFFYLQLANRNWRLPLLPHIEANPPHPSPPRWDIQDEEVIRGILARNLGGMVHYGIGAGGQSPRSARQTKQGWVLDHIWTMQAMASHLLFSLKSKLRELNSPLHIYTQLCHESIFTYKHIKILGN